MQVTDTKMFLRAKVSEQCEIKFVRSRRFIFKKIDFGKLSCIHF